MGDLTGFLKHGRRLPERRPVDERLQDWKEVYKAFGEEALRTQASRCMDCGIPFCNNGCPLGNLIPDWNDLVYRGQWRQAAMPPTISPSSPPGCARPRVKPPACSESAMTR